MVPLGVAMIGALPAILALRSVRSVHTTVKRIANGQYDELKKRIDELEKEIDIVYKAIVEVLARSERRKWPR